jgi:predicted dehydrogenase
MTLSAGVVGLGKVAKHSHLPVYAGRADVSLDAIADIDEKTRRDVKSEFSVSDAYETGVEMLQESDLDIVSICTPPSAHLETAIVAAETSTALLCEKPVALTIEAVEEILEAVTQAGVVAAGGYSLQFRPTFKRAVKQYTHGLVGPLRRIEVLYSGKKPTRDWQLDPNVAGGGVLMALLPHVLSYFMHLTDKEFCLETATPRRFLAPNIESDVRLTGNLADVKMTVTTGWRTYSAPSRLDLYGEEGVISISFDKLTIDTYGSSFRYQEAGLPEIDLEKVATRYPSANDSPPSRVHGFVNAVLGDSENIAPIEHSLPILKTIRDVYETINVSTPLTKK